MWLTILLCRSILEIMTVTADFCQGHRVTGIQQHCHTITGRLIFLTPVIAIGVTTPCCSHTIHTHTHTYKLYHAHIYMHHKVIESSAEGLRKPDRNIYDLTLERLGVQPSEAVFLDDLSGNLKTAQEMGMYTIKVCSLTFDL